MIYQRQGQLAPKRHTQFRSAKGDLYYEEVVGTRGFSGAYSTLYHLRPPTAAARFKRLEHPPMRLWDLPDYRQHHLRTRDVPAGGDSLRGRVPLLFNQDITLSVARPTEDQVYQRNGEADELYYVHEGSGELLTAFGSLSYRPGDYLVIPRGITYRILLGQDSSRFLVLEGYGPIEVPSRYRNEFGQILEHAPYAQRDIRTPEFRQPRDEGGRFEVLVKLRDVLMAYEYSHHPFDAVGWDGYLYPWALNIADFEPITGRVHQPPPAHQTFQGPSFVVCSFVPRKLDYHPLAVPSPYAHSNVDSDEVLYYVSGNYTSRKGIEQASITLHRHGLPHGPQPGAIETSLGAQETSELAVMVDTFRPLHLTDVASRYDDPVYPLSWST